mgnify:FL=1
MPISRVEGTTWNYVITHFKEISDMHTYLVAFTISDFDHIEDFSVDPPQRIYARQQRLDNGDAQFALDVSPPIMRQCEEYYGINYTFPKMDQVAVTMFPAWAVRNFHLIYIEVATPWNFIFHFRWRTGA